MKTPSTTNNTVTLTKPNTNSNPMKTPKTFRSLKPAHILVGSIAALSGLAVPTNSDAAVAPYSADANTVHLWHFDEALVTVGGEDPHNHAGRLYPVDAPGVVGPAWRLDDGYFDGTYKAGIMGGTGYTGFGGAGQLDHQGGNGLDGHHFEFRRGPTNFGIPPGGTAGTTPTATELLGSTSGAFTIDGMIKWNGSQGGSTEGAILECTNGATNATGTLRLRMLNAGTVPVFTIGLPNNHSFTTTAGLVPTLTTTDWYHFAMTFDGNNAGGSPLKFYWTKVDPNAPQANLVQTFSSNSTTAYNVLVDFQIGQWGGLNFDGQVDEVRISNVARSSRQMLFTPNLVNGLAAGDWNVAGTWNPSGVPNGASAVTINANAVTINSGVSVTPATSFGLTVSGGGSVVMTNQSLTVVGDFVTDMNTTGGTLSLDATSTLTIPKANTSASFAGLTVAAGATLNVTSELTVDSVKDLSGAIINTPKVTFSGGSLVVGTVNLQANTLTAGDATESTFGGALNATTGTVVKQGGGVLNLAPGAVLTLNTLTANDGTLNVNSALGNAVVSVSDAPGGSPTKLRFGSVSQTLSSLTIGAGATVVFTSGAASGAFSGDDKGAGFSGGATVPEPGTIGLLLVGAIGMLSRRRRA
jgi:hypothetical protein